MSLEGVRKRLAEYSLDDGNEQRFLFAEEVLLANAPKDLDLMANVVEAAKEIFMHERCIEWPYGDLLKEALEAFEATP